MLTLAVLLEVMLFNGPLVWENVFRLWSVNRSLLLMQYWSSGSRSTALLKKQIWLW
jgi:hypothetical protein